MTEDEVKRIMSTLSSARMARYVELARGKGCHPLDLYLHNERLSASLQFILSMWEVVLRNRLSAFLSWKYSADWPYQDRLLRQLAREDAERLIDSRKRQAADRKVPRATTDSIVADLSVGFWVSLLTRHYEVPFAWRRGGNLSRVFPNRPDYSLTDVQPLLGQLRTLRNRAAHREPILSMDLPRLKTAALELTSAMCSDTGAFVRANCDFDECWRTGPGTAIISALRRDGQTAAEELRVEDGDDAAAG